MIMLFWLKQIMIDYLKNKWPILLLVTVFFCTGIFFGSIAAKSISIDQSDQLSAYFNEFLDKADSALVKQQTNVYQNIFSNLYIMIGIYILGLTVIGMPFVLAVVFSRGFVLGFTVGFLIREKAFKGFVFAVVSVLPQNVLIIPAVLLGGMMSLSFSIYILKRKFSARKISVKGSLGAYTAIMAILCLLVSGAGLIETYLTPVIIKTAVVWVR
jgi:stage II sporulation protein M